MRQPSNRRPILNASVVIDLDRLPPSVEPIRSITPRARDPETFTGRYIEEIGLEALPAQALKSATVVEDGPSGLGKHDAPDAGRPRETGLLALDVHDTKPSAPVQLRHDTRLQHL